MRLDPRLDIAWATPRGSVGSGAARGLRRGRLATALIGILIAASATARAQVVLSEVHYHPFESDEGSLEFVEIHNSGPARIDISAWRFSRGIDFEFPPGTSLSPRGFLVVARDREALVRSYDLEPSLVFGDFRGALDNDGERLALVDADGAWVDGIDFDDRDPWPESADGDGPSLERLCVSDAASGARSWHAGGPGESPTPLAPSRLVVCPAPAYERALIAITEIHYHPPAEGAEFVELLNPGDARVDVGRWSLLGVGYSFPPGSSIDAGERVVVARDRERFLARFGQSTPYGDYSGALSNDGERLALVDANGELVESVRYDPDGDWPREADGLGHSLERIAIDQDPDDPANWAPSVLVSGRFEVAEAEGALDGPGSVRILLGIDGAGELIVDQLELVRVEEPGENLIPGGDFETERDAWEIPPALEGSEFVGGAGRDGSTGLHLIAQEACGGAGCEACSLTRSAQRSIEFDGTGGAMRLRLVYRHLSGSSRLYCRVSRGGPQICLGDAFATPGAPNGREAPHRPPFLRDRGRAPEAPTSDDEVVLSVRSVAGSREEFSRVVLESRIADEDWTTTPMERLPSDERLGAVWIANLPPLSHDTVVLYRFVGTHGDGSTVSSPRSIDTGQRGPDEIWGYYVRDARPRSALHAYQLLVDGVDPSDPRALNEQLACGEWRVADFVQGGEVFPEVRIRARGETACLLEKRNLKIRFRRGRTPEGRREINLQGLWTDKSLVREHLAWEVARELGLPALETEFARVDLNGVYHGLYLELEQPDETFLERRGRNPHDCIYKAVRPPTTEAPVVGMSLPSRPEDLELLWERESCKDLDLAELNEFLRDLHEVNTPSPSAAFFLARTRPREILAFQALHVLLDSRDYFSKNHLLYWDRSNDRWSLWPWDLDLVLGKRFDARLNQTFPPRTGGVNDCLSGPGDDVTPWFTTTVEGNERRHWLLDYFFRADGDHFQRAHAARLWRLLDEKLSSVAMNRRLARIYEELGEEPQVDLQRWGRTPVTCFADCTQCNDAITATENALVLVEQAGIQASRLRDELARQFPGIAGWPRVKISEIFYDADDDEERLEFVELASLSQEDIDLSGWSFEEGLGGFEFPAGALLPAGGLAVVARDPLALVTAHPILATNAAIFGPFSGRLRNEGERIRLVDGGPGFPATVDLVHYRDGARDFTWPRVRDGYSIELREVLASTDNDRGERWLASTRRGGTPGEIPGRDRPFVRGDASGDGTLRISDAVLTLLHLFAQGAPPACLDASDFDDDGSLTLSDATGLLVFLFRGGGPPPAPFPAAGPDPTPDGLGCEGIAER